MTGGRNLHAFGKGLRSLLKMQMLVFGARVAGAVLGIGSQILLARIFGAETLGVFYLAVSLATVLSILCTLGYPWILAPIVARSEKDRDSSLLATFLSQARRELRVVSTVLVALVILLILFLPILSDSLRISLILGAITAPIFAVMRLNGTLANAGRRFLLAFLPDVFFRPLLVLVLIGALWVSPLSFDVTALVAGHLVIVIVLVALQGHRLRTTAANLAPESSAIVPLKPGQGRKWRDNAMAMIIATLFIGVFSDLDLIIVGTVLSESQTAIFGAAIKMAMFLAFSIQVVHQLILRDAADALHDRDHQALSAVLLRANTINLVTGIGATFAVLLFGRNILGFFGPEFEQGHACLIILVLAQTIRAAAGPTTQLLNLTGQEKAAIPVFGVGLVLLVIANLLLVPRYELVGAAVAVLLVTMVWSIWLALVIKARTGLDVAIVPLPRIEALSGTDSGTA